MKYFLYLVDYFVIRLNVIISSIHNSNLIINENVTNLSVLYLLAKQIIFKSFLHSFLPERFNINFSLIVIIKICVPLKSSNPRKIKVKSQNDL